MLEKLIEVFTPARGAAGTTLGFICGILPNFEESTKDNITFMFQIAAFSITILVGILTIIHLFCKLKDRRRSQQAIKTDDED